MTAIQPLPPPPAREECPAPRSSSLHNTKTPPSHDPVSGQSRAKWPPPRITDFSAWRTPSLVCIYPISLVWEPRSCQLMPRTTPLSDVVVPDRGLGGSPAAKPSPCQHVTSPPCPKPAANLSSSQTSKPSATMRSLPSTASKPTTPSSPRRSTRASLRTCSTTTTPS